MEFLILLLIAFSIIPAVVRPKKQSGKTSDEQAEKKDPAAFVREFFPQFDWENDTFAQNGKLQEFPEEEKNGRETAEGSQEPIIFRSETDFSRKKEAHRYSSESRHDVTHSYQGSMEYTDSEPSSEGIGIHDVMRYENDPAAAYAMFLELEKKRQTEHAAVFETKPVQSGASPTIGTDGAARKGGAADRDVLVNALIWGEVLSRPRCKAPYRAYGKGDM